uniref:SFRICE_013475 n=1 Tax=Spodoptera frugiperda TaxID=7108 RepID=A0A2H1VQB2_SPOFR
MDVAGALLPFTQVVRPELTIHVQEVLTQADKEADGSKPRNTIPEINEPSDKDDEVNLKSVHINKSANDNGSRKYCDKSANGKNSEVRSCDVVTMKNPRKGSPA